jgi:hypothetical protein
MEGTEVPVEFILSTFLRKALDGYALDGQWIWLAWISRPKVQGF